MSLCFKRLIINHDIKPFRDGGINPRIPNLGISYRTVAILVCRPFYRRSINTFPYAEGITDWVSRRASVDVSENKKAACPYRESKHDPPIVNPAEWPKGQV